MIRHLELGAWLTNDWTPIKELYKDDGKALEELIYSANDMSGMRGWVRVGTAEVALDLFPERSVVGEKIKDFREQIKATKAESEQKVTNLTEKINSLLALSNEARNSFSRSDVPVPDPDDDIPF